MPHAELSNQALLADDAVALPPGEAPVVGQPAIHDWLRKNRMDTTRIEVVEYTVDVQETKVTGDIAIELARTKITVKTQGSGGNPAVTVSGNLLLIFRRQTDGAWKVWRSIWNQATQ